MFVAKLALSALSPQPATWRARRRGRCCTCAPPSRATVRAHARQARARSRGRQGRDRSSRSPTLARSARPRPPRSTSSFSRPSRRRSCGDRCTASRTTAASRAWRSRDAIGLPPAHASRRSSKSAPPRSSPCSTAGTPHPCAAAATAPAPPRAPDPARRWRAQQGAAVPCRALAAGQPARLHRHTQRPQPRRDHPAQVLGGRGRAAE